MLAQMPVALTQAPTIDLDTTDVKIYGGLRLKGRQPCPPGQAQHDGVHLAQ